MTIGHINGEKKYTGKKFYNFCFQDLNPPAPMLWIWKSKLWPKLKVFLWLLMVDRLNTRNMLKRRKFNIGNNFECPLSNLDNKLINQPYALF